MCRSIIYEQTRASGGYGSKLLVELKMDTSSSRAKTGEKSKIRQGFSFARVEDEGFSPARLFPSSGFCHTPTTDQGPDCIRPIYQE